MTTTTNAGSSKSTARYPELARYVREHAIRTGTFTLASGKTSNIYCDGRLVTLSGEGASLVTDALVDLLDGEQFDAIGGMEMGAIPMVAALGLRYQQLGRSLPMFVVRKQVKSYGTQKRIEGPLAESPQQVVMLEDVVTSGGSILDAVRVVRDAGHTVLMVVCMLDREQGGRAALEAEDVRFESLVKLSELSL